MFATNWFTSRLCRSAFDNAHDFMINNSTFVNVTGNFVNNTNYGSVLPESSLPSTPELQLEESDVVKFLMKTLEENDGCFSELSGLALEINTNIRGIQGEDSQNQEDIAAAACDAVFATIHHVYSTSQQEPNEPQSAKLARLEGLKQTLSELRAFSEAKRLGGTVYSSLPFYDADKNQMNEFSLRLQFHTRE
ncbi:hypothetical protein PQX77_001859, partial [Marasmius sp. AFHP31]